MKRKNLLKIFNLGIPKSQKEIEAIKNDFLLNDIQYKDALRNGQPLILDLNESKIQVEVIVAKSVRYFQDEFGFEEEEVDFEYDIINIDFYEEFEAALEIAFENYCNKFLSELDKKGVYAAEDLEGFTNIKLKKINDLISDLQKNSDIENHVKACLLEFYNKLYDFISNFKSENYQVSNKLKFKLNKNQLIWLFHSMLEKGVIAGITQTDLYRILETNSMYYDNGKYEDMVGVRIQASKLIKGHSSPEKSIEFLSKIFDKDFFSSSL